MKWVRKLVYELMVAAPFLFLAIIAVRSRLNVDPYLPVDNTPELEARISAYVQPVRNVMALGSKGPTELNPDSVRRIASEWIAAHRRGELKPLVPGYFGESVRDGIKGQVFAAKDRLTLGLLALAQQEATTGRPEQACRDYVSAYRLCQIAKFSDFMSVVDASRRQCRILDALGPLLEGAESTVRTEIASLVEPDSGARIAKMLALGKGLYATMSIAPDTQPAIDTRAYKIVSDAFKSGAATRKSLSVVRSAIIESKGELPRVYSQAKLAWQQESKLIERFDELARDGRLPTRPNGDAGVVAMITR